MSLGRFYQYFFDALWLVLVVFWVARSRDVKVTVRRQARLPRLVNLTLIYGAAALLAGPFVPLAWLTERVIPGALWRVCGALGAGLTLLGVLTMIWARIHLGRNWSSVAAVKIDHELVIDGPYRWMRHPIYAGLLLAFIGTAIAIGQWRGVLAVALALVAFMQRIIVEDRFMREQFGAAYEAYARRVRALVPGVL
ncbi:MAG: methyltransferase family protein [Steroidobacteraceae bacterium]